MSDFGEPLTPAEGPYATPAFEPREAALTTFRRTPTFLTAVVAGMRAKQLKRGASARLHELSDSAFGTLLPRIPRSAEQIALEEVRRGLVEISVPDDSSGDLTPERKPLPLVGEQGSAITATVYRVEDVRLLQALVAAVSPRVRTTEQLTLADTITASPHEQASWIGSYLARPVISPHWRPSDRAETRVEPQSRVLGAALGLLSAVWKAEPNPQAYQLALVAANGDRSGAEFAFEGPALVLKEGSLVGDLVHGSVQLPRALVALVFVGPTARAGNLAHRLRRKASERPEARSLKAVDDPALAAELAGKSGLVILVHGLLSTDVGLFDGLLTRLDALPSLTAVGYPHDTLAPIHANGQELAEAIDRIVRDARLPVVVACHSRGGLVARDALVALAPASRPFIRGCVTFGTPHRGARLAESPRKLVAAFAVAAAGRNSGSFASLEDCLAYVLRANPTGILDLVPAEGGGRFLLDLVDRERQSEFKPDFLAVGGVANPPLGLRWLLGENLGARHDLVVSLDSSMPPRYPGHAAECDHFSYFSQPASLDQASHLDAAISFIRDKLVERARP